MNIPDNKTAIRLLKKFENPIHIIRHCVRVKDVSTFLSERLCKKGVHLNKDLVRAGALLHDISKHRSIESGGDHAIMGGKILKEMGYSEVAQIVVCHVHLSRSLLESGKISEALIVNYADKRVKHTEVVSLHDRFEDLLIRYGLDESRRKMIRTIYRESKKMEDLIFSRLDIGPDDLTQNFRRKSQCRRQIL